MFVISFILRGFNYENNHKNNLSRKVGVTVNKCIIKRSFPECVTVYMYINYKKGTSIFSWQIKHLWLFLNMFQVHVAVSIHYKHMTAKQEFKEKYLKYVLFTNP